MFTLNYAQFNFSINKVFYELFFSIKKLIETLPSLGFVLKMLHKAFRCGVMVHNCHIMLLEGMQNGNIHFNQRFVLPQ